MLTDPRRSLQGLGIGAILAGIVAPMLNGTLGDPVHISKTLALGALADLPVAAE